VKPLCIYHGNCQDGFGAAWAVRHALGDDVEFHPGVYQNDPPDVTGRDVMLVDFSYKRPVLEAMSTVARSVAILDHHKSARDDLAGLPEPLAWGSGDEWSDLCALFDMDRSGAGLAWDYFHPGQPRPKLIDHIEDRDLWRFSHPNTRAVAAALFSYPYEFELWDRLVEHCENVSGYQMFIASGEAIERKHHKDVAELVSVTRREMVIGGYVVPVANLPYTLTSDAGHLLCEYYDRGLAGSYKPPFAACYWDTPEGRVFSLRSRDDGADVSAIAKAYGGGGHAHAAGFRMPIGWEGDAL
jgi:oligoribonuclease NrnB/cAMP/cGMP phosphodiesterase (DHH superfamily)